MKFALRQTEKNVDEFMMMMMLVPPEYHKLIKKNKLNCYSLKRECYQAGFCITALTKESVAISILTKNLF